MELTSVTWLVTLLIGLLSFYLWATYTKLKQFRGPRWTGISNWPHSLAILSGNCHEWYAEVSLKYGPLARVAPRVLITSDPGVWMAVNSRPGWKRSDWYYRAARIEHRKDNVFSQTDNEKHDQRRKQMAPGYSGRENLLLEESVDQQLQDLMTLIRTKYISTDQKVIPMDLAKKVQYFTLDVISSVGLGKGFGMLKSDCDVDSYLQSSEEGLAICNTALALGFAWLTQAPFIGKFIAPSPKDNNGFGKMMDACFRIVDARDANPSNERSDMLGSFMRHGIRGEDLRSEALEQIIAGSDTTAGAIRGALLHVITNPRVYSKLQREIDDAVRTGLAPSEGFISLAQTKQLPYLQAVINESLRVWPPVTNIFARDVPPGGDTVVLDGEKVFLPGGVCVGYSAYAMHHSETVYGEDAKVFRPERWIEPDSPESDKLFADKLLAMKLTNNLTFGYSRFQCLGRPVAQLELGKVIFELLRNFDLTIINPTHPWKTKNLLGLFAISDMWVQIQVRT